MVTPSATMRAISASSTARGRRYLGMPKRIMPPASGPASRIVTACPARASWYAADRPEGPAPTTSTRLPARLRRRRELPAEAQGLVADEALDRVDADALVQLRAVAGGLARVIADAAHAGRQRVGFGQQPPGPFVVARLGVEQPALDVLARRAGVVARRQAVDVDRPHRAPGAGVVGQAGAGVERDRERLLHVASSGSPSRPKRCTLRSARAWMRATRSACPGGLNRCAKRVCGLR